jgi:hypothetical protein
MNEDTLFQFYLYPGIRFLEEIKKSILDNFTVPYAILKGSQAFA